jgi:MFS family permease
MKQNHEFRNLLIINVFMLAGMFFGGSLFEVYFYNMGLSLPEIYFADLLWFLVGLLLIPVFKKFESRRFMLIGLVISILSALALLIYKDPMSAYVYRILLGTTIPFIWIPLNIRFFEFSHENNATLGAIYHSIVPLLSLLLPAFSGSVAEVLGFDFLFMLAMASYAIAFVLTRIKFRKKTYRYDTLKSVDSLRGLRTIIFLEGFSITSIISVTLPVMLLLFTERPVEFGLFLSLSTIFSVAASFLISNLSDRYHRRWIFILSSATGFALASLLAASAPDIAIFFLGFGAVNFFSRLFMPISVALAVDKSKDLAATMAGREVLLGIGRVLGLAFGLLLMLYFDIQTALMLQGFALLLYIPVWELRARKILRI